MKWNKIIEQMIKEGTIKPIISSISDVDGNVLYDKNIYKMEQDYIAYYNYRKDQYGLGYKF